MNEKVEIVSNYAQPDKVVIRYQPQTDWTGVVYMTVQFGWTPMINEAIQFDTVVEATLFVAIANLKAEQDILRHQIQTISKAMGVSDV